MANLGFFVEKLGFDLSNARELLITGKTNTPSVGMTFPGVGSTPWVVGDAPGIQCVAFGMRSSQVTKLGLIFLALYDGSNDFAYDNHGGVEELKEGSRIRQIALLDAPGVTKSENGVEYIRYTGVYEE